MAIDTGIEWCDHTASPWYGCEHDQLADGTTHPGCENCYAEAMAKRNPASLGIWGPDGVRVKSKSFVGFLEKVNRRAARNQRRETVFASMCDPFEDRPELVPWREEMFAVIDRCLWVTMILLTKRPENIRRMWPCYVIPPHRQYRENVWLLGSISNQPTADEIVPHVLKCRDLSPVLGISAEPLLGPIQLQPVIREGRFENHQGINLDWVISGCESKGKKLGRYMDPAWVETLASQCAAAGVPFFNKQMGIDGQLVKDIDKFPEHLRVRQLPGEASQD